MTLYHKNCLLITAIAVTGWLCVGATGAVEESEGDTAESRPYAAECGSSDLLEKLESLAAWRRRVFKESSLEDVFLRHNTANLSYIDRLELVNRVMVDVLLQAIPDNSSPHKAPHIDPPLLAPRKGPAYRRRGNQNEDLSSEQNYSESLTFDVEDQIAPNSVDVTTESTVVATESPVVATESTAVATESTAVATESAVVTTENTVVATESTVVANETEVPLNGEAHIIAVSRTPLASPKALMFPVSEIDEEATHKIQAHSGTVETVVYDREDIYNKSTDNLTSEQDETIQNDKNCSSNPTGNQCAPSLKVIPNWSPENSSYLSVFRKKAPRVNEKNSSHEEGEESTVNLKRSPNYEDIDSNVTTAVQFNGAVSLNTAGNGLLADPKRDGTISDGKQMRNSTNSDSVLTKNQASSREIGQRELELPKETINNPAMKGQGTNAIPGDILIQINVSNFDALKTKNCLMSFLLNSDEGESELKIERANFEACVSLQDQNFRTVEWLKQIFIKLSNFFGSHARSLSRILSQWSTSREAKNSSQPILFPPLSTIPSTPNISITNSNVTLSHEVTGVEDDNPDSSSQHLNITSNTSENATDGKHFFITGARNLTSGAPRKPKMLSNDMILQEINTRANNTSGASSGLFASNYSQQPSLGEAGNGSACALQTRWNKAEHLQRAIELLLLSVPVSLEEMMEAASHPFLDDFIFRPEGRSIFAVMRQCAKCYMKDPLGRCREVLFCKNGVSVSSRILG